MPLLNYLIENAPRRILKTVFLSCVFFFCIVDPTKENIYYSLDRGYSFVWLAVLYMIGGYIAKYNPFEKLSTPKAFGLYFLASTFTMMTRLTIAVGTKIIFGVSIKEDIFIEYTFISVLFSAIFLLHAFSKMKLNKGNVCASISLISSTSFGVYIIHTTPFMWGLMKDGFIWCISHSPIVGLMIIFGVAIAIFIVGMLIDLIRQGLFSLCKIRELSIWIEKSLRKVVSAIRKLFNISLSSEVEKEE